MAKRPGDIVDWRKSWEWASDDYDPTTGGPDEVEEINIDELMLPKDAKGIGTLDTENTRVAGGGARGWKAQEIAMDWAWDRYGKEFYDLSDALQMELYGEALDFVDEAGMAEGGRIGLKKGSVHAPGTHSWFLQHMNKKAGGGRIGYAYGPNDPGEIVEDDLTTVELMQDQGIPYGPQASGINKDVLIEKVVEEFIKRKGRKPRSIEEIKEFYMMELAGGSEGPQRVAYNPGDYDPMIVEEYEKYKAGQEGQGPVMSIDEFLLMERSNVARGGLPGILGV